MHPASIESVRYLEDSDRLKTDFNTTRKASFSDGWVGKRTAELGFLISPENFTGPTSISVELELDTVGHWKVTDLITYRVKDPKHPAYKAAADYLRNYKVLKNTFESDIQIEYYSSRVSNKTAVFGFKVLGRHDSKQKQLYVTVSLERGSDNKWKALDVKSGI